MMKISRIEEDKYFEYGDRVGYKTTMVKRTFWVVVAGDPLGVFPVHDDFDVKPIGTIEVKYTVPTVKFKRSP